MICSSLNRLLRTTPPPGPERVILNGEVTFPLDYFPGGRSQNVPGTPPVTDTILGKIEKCDIFLPDVTFVATTHGGKLVPNPNVMAEYGYALRARTVDAMMPIMNTAFGPPEKLPFDMGHLRHPIQYSVEATASDAQRRADRDKLSKKIEERLRLQIALTQPPPPPPMPFQQSESKEGPARFRAKGLPIGKRWNDLPMPRSPKQDIFLAAGPAMWLRLMPATADPNKKSIYDLKSTAMMAGNFPLSPFYMRQGMGNNIYLLKAEDGMGTCDLDAPDAAETPSVAFAFRTGEVWAIDTTILTYHPGLLVGDIERLYSTRLENYAHFLGAIGVPPPYRWISGIADVKGRVLQIPVSPQATNPFFSGPECLAEKIIEEGTYDGKQTPASALANFFDAIFNECGSARPKR